MVNPRPQLISDGHECPGSQPGASDDCGSVNGWTIGHSLGLRPGHVSSIALWAIPTQISDHSKYQYSTLASPWKRGLWSQYYYNQQFLFFSKTPCSKSWMLMVNKRRAVIGKRVEAGPTVLPRTCLPGSLSCSANCKVLQSHFERLQWSLYV